MNFISVSKNIVRVLLGLFMTYAAVSHFSFNRVEFQAQVPEWLPLGKDFVVIASGIVELLLGLGMLLLTKHKAKVGAMLALFYILIFPGNINQYVNGIDAFGLDSDMARFIRLLFQPVLIIMALWSTNAISYIKSLINREKVYIK